MTKLILRRVRWKNFLSTGNEWTEIDLDVSKTCLVIGPNGSGKSTMLDAISFGLFNKPFRNINKTQLPNTITNKDCLVEIEFVINSHKFKVIRGIKPTVFEIYKKENERNIINEKLKLTYEHIKEIQDSTDKAIREKNERIGSAQNNVTI